MRGLSLKNTDSDQSKTRHPTIQKPYAKVSADYLKLLNYKLKAN